ncbi:MAG: SDR family NAD(P)-dependent oxidoreductase, partial [Chloroflexi bacterium]|nr:SDR family NAD(P)-dependent oxidoreductase [Chloroflexota bacterium]
MGDLDGKVAIITGAGRLRGIGRACAVALAAMGADIVPTGTGRSPESYPQDEKDAGWKDIESTAQQVRDLGRRALPVVGDVSRSEDVQRMVQQTMDEFGRIDILINNAAYKRGEDRVTVDQLDEEVWRRVLDVKVTGAFLFSKAVAQIMMGRGEGGRIINISSIAG